MLTEVETELTEIIGILESQIPANINRRENLKLERELKADLQKYFNALGAVFPYDAIEQLYYKQVGGIPPVKESKFIESVKEAEPLVIIGPPGPQGVPGVNGRDGKDGRDGTDGKDGTNGIDGKAGKDGINGRDGLDGKNGIDGRDGISIKGDKGDRGELGKDGTSDLDPDIKAALNGSEASANNKFITDNDPRLKEKEPLPHKHPEIQPMIYAPTVSTGGITSTPPAGKYKVLNLFVEPDTGKLTVEYEMP